MATGGVTTGISSEIINMISLPNSSTEIQNNDNPTTCNSELVTSLSNEYASLIEIHCGKEVSFLML